MKNNQLSIKTVQYFKSMSKYLANNKVSFDDYIKIYELFKEAKKDHLLSSKFTKNFEKILRCSLIIIINKEEREALKSIKAELEEMLNNEKPNTRK